MRAHDINNTKLERSSKWICMDRGSPTGQQRVGVSIWRRADQIIFLSAGGSETVARPSTSHCPSLPSSGALLYSTPPVPKTRVAASTCDSPTESASRSTPRRPCCFRKRSTAERPAAQLTPPVPWSAPSNTSAPTALPAARARSANRRACPAGVVPSAPPTRRSVGGRPASDARESGEREAPSSCGQCAGTEAGSQPPPRGPKRRKVPASTL
mmetsp:Transcript_2095/g.6295  ORF Transcript_2095/g.6295 Transcript_2095/m.6295 type:complete len:212 (-) Transcript_2095:779-1414(-)